MKMLVRFFISSPKDVAVERALALRVLKSELPSDPLLKGRLFTDIVAWDDTPGSPFLANCPPQKAITKFKGEPNKCDVFIIILGSRLGTPPGGEFIRPDGQPYSSGTEFEFDNACAARPPIDILLYAKKDPDKISLDDPDFIEKKRQFELLQAFITRIRDHRSSIYGGMTSFGTTTEFESYLYSRRQSSCP